MRIHGLIVPIGVNAMDHEPGTLPRLLVENSVVVDSTSFLLPYCLQHMLAKSSVSMRATIKMVRDNDFYILVSLRSGEVSGRSICDVNLVWEPPIIHRRITKDSPLRRLTSRESHWNHCDLSLVSYKRDSLLTCLLFTTPLN